MFTKIKKESISYCLHSKISKEYNINSVTYLYCLECGNISIKHNNNFIYTIKPKQKQKKAEVNPIIVIRKMKENQNITFPNIDNIYNINHKIEKLEDITKKVYIYSQKRKLLLYYLQNITKKLSYSDLSFYHTLFFIDLYFTHNIKEDMTEEELLYLLIGFFLVASKFYETDIFEPEMYNFNNINSGILLSSKLLLLYEMNCLKFLNYNIISYSTFEWLNVITSNGYIFEGEIDNSDYINEIHLYTLKLLIALTPKIIFIKYSPLYNAIAIVQIGRENKIGERKINKELFMKLLLLYDIDNKIYEKCYKDMKEVLSKDSNATQIKTIKNRLTDDKTPNKNENNKVENNNLEIRKVSKSTEKEFNNNTNIIFNTNTDSKTNNLRTINGEKTIDASKQTNLLFKEKVLESKVNLRLFKSNENEKEKTKKDMHSIIVNNNNNKIHNFNINKKNIEILDYLSGNLPNIYKYNVESIKALKTEENTLRGKGFKSIKFKNDKLNNFSFKNKIIKHNGGTSFDNKNYKINRNGTYDLLEDVDRRISKILFKKNKTLANLENGSTYLNKSGDYLNYHATNDINDKNIYSNRNNRKPINLISNYDTKYMKNNHNKLNIYKNTSNIFNNNSIKQFYKQATTNNLFTDENILKRKLNLNKKDKMDKKNISLEKGRKSINNLINNYNKKSFIKLNNERGTMNFNDLLGFRKFIFNNRNLPKLK